MQVYFYNIQVIVEDPGHRSNVAVAGGTFSNVVGATSSEGLRLAVWRYHSIVHRMNEVTLRRARLVLGWVTIFGRVYHIGL